MAKKSVKVWIFLLIAPFVLLFVTAGAQFVVRFALSSSACTCSPEGNYPNDPSTSNEGSSNNSQSPITDAPCRPNSNVIKVIVNIFSLLLGVAAVLGILGTPIWIIFLVRAIQHNNALESPQQPNNIPH